MWTWQFAQLQHVAEMNKWTKFISMQNHYSLLYREEEREMIPYCQTTGVGIIPWSPLARGHLARSLSKGTKTARKNHEPNSEEAAKLGFAVYQLGLTDIDQATIARVEELAEKKGWSMAAVGLAWINGKVDAPIVGLGSVERMEEAVGAAEKRLEPEEVAYLEELYAPRTVIGH